MIGKSEIDSIFFDLDGTLWDGVNCYAQGFNDFFEFNNIDRRLTVNDLYNFMGLEEDEYLEVMLPEFQLDRRKLMYNDIVDFQYKRIKSGGGILYEGVKNGLYELSRKHKLFIVSNCSEFTIKHFMDWSGIEGCITDTMSHGMNFKPKHENINFLIKKHNLVNSVYVGDTESDSEQSRLAKVPFVFVDYGFGVALNYDLRFDSFSTLTNYFK